MGTEEMKNEVKFEGGGERIECAAFGAGKKN